MPLIIHNILWSSYKATVFSELYSIGIAEGIKYKFIHISELDKYRVNLGNIKYSSHKYPYTLLFKGSRDEKSLLSIIYKSFFSIFLTGENIVILSGFSTIESWVMLLACIIKRKKIGLFCDSTLNDNKFNIFKYLLKKIFIKRCNFFLVYGNKSKEYIEFLGGNRDVIYTRCQAANYSTYDNLEKLIKIRLNRKRVHKFTFLFVGRLSKEKRLFDLIYAFKRCLTSHDNIRLLIVGDGPDYMKINEYIKSMDILQNAIILEGSKNHDEMSDYYLKADCLVLPSISEPWGLVVNESLYHGCPAIVSDKCGCVDDLITEGENGYKFMAKDIADLSIKMNLAVENFHHSNLIVTSCKKSISQYTPQEAAKQIHSAICNESRK